MILVDLLMHFEQPWSDILSYLSFSTFAQTEHKYEEYPFSHSTGNNEFS